MIVQNTRLILRNSKLKSDENEILNSLLACNSLDFIACVENINFIMTQVLWCLPEPPYDTIKKLLLLLISWAPENINLSCTDCEEEPYAKISPFLDFIFAHEPRQGQDRLHGIFTLLLWL